MFLKYSPIQTKVNMRIITLFALLLMTSNTTKAQEQNYQLSSHILDITLGKPAAKVNVVLSKKEKENWIVLDKKVTDENGRIKEFLKKGISSNKGIYKLTFHTGAYFKSLNMDTFYPFIEVVFEINNEEHYHVPITLSPYGYSTYRGS